MLVCCNTDFVPLCSMAHCAKWMEALPADPQPIESQLPDSQATLPLLDQEHRSASQQPSLPRSESGASSCTSPSTPAPQRKRPRPGCPGGPPLSLLNPGHKRHKARGSRLALDPNSPPYEGDGQVPHRPASLPVLTQAQMAKKEAKKEAKRQRRALL